MTTSHRNPGITPARTGGGRGARSGLTLIETMIALSFLVLGVFTVFDALTTSRRSHERSTHMALAYQEIQAQIETLQFMPFITVRQSFKGIGFKVAGLRPPTGRPVCGTVTRLENPNPYDLTLVPNPNTFPQTDNTLPLRLRVEWADPEGTAWVEVIYVLAYRGI